MHLASYASPITYKGRSVVTLETFCKDTQSNYAINYQRIRRDPYFIQGEDYFFITGLELIEFKARVREEFGLDTRFINKIQMLTESGVKKLKGIIESIHD